MAGKGSTVLRGMAFVAIAVGGFGAGAYLWAGGKVDSLRNRKLDVKGASIEPFKGQADLALGQRIYDVRGGCGDCHAKDLGGRTIVDDGALGVFSGPNISQARLASWTDDEIARAVRHGVGKNGKPLFLMPSLDYFNLSGGDLASLVAYMRSVPAVERASIPLSFGPVGRMLLATRKIPGFAADELDHDEPLGEKPPEEANAAFGSYLANACVGCHGAELKGGPIPGGAPHWPPASDISPAVIGAWSEETFLKVMRTGVNPSGKTLGEPFPKALFEQMTDTELKALYLYLARKG